MIATAQHLTLVIQKSPRDIKRFYFEMELVDGVALAKRILDQSKKKLKPQSNSKTGERTTKNEEEDQQNTFSP
jgi:hypothetical protein